MNFTQSFEEFSKGLETTDLVLYAGIALVVWILFKDKLTPLQGLIKLSVENLKRLLTVRNKPTPISSLPADSDAINAAPVVLAKSLAENSKLEPEDLFFKLVISWKETRDLALRCGCSQAVEVADSMFPYLSPNICKKESENEQ